MFSDLHTSLRNGSGKFRGRVRQGVRNERPDLIDQFSPLGLPRTWREWEQMLYSVESGKSGFEKSLGMPMFECLADRVTIEAGSFFERVPSGGDAYLLSHIIHDWSEEQRLTILGNCRRAMNCAHRITRESRRSRSCLTVSQENMCHGQQ
jgi:hypothetical protein